VDVLGIEYVELLNKYHVAWYFYLFAIFKIIICLWTINYSKLWETSQSLCMASTQTKDKSRLHQVSHDAWEGVVYLQTELQSAEECLQVGEWWTPDSPEDQHASNYLCIWTYQCAVDRLEGLAVQQLFELMKANVSQTGQLASYIHIVRHSQECIGRLQATCTCIKSPEVQLQGHTMSPHGLQPSCNNSWSSTSQTDIGPNSRVHHTCGIWTVADRCPWGYMQ